MMKDFTLNYSQSDFIVTVTDSNFLFHQFPLQKPNLLPQISRFSSNCIANLQISKHVMHIKSFNQLKLSFSLLFAQKTQNERLLCVQSVFTYYLGAHGRLI